MLRDYYKILEIDRHASAVKVKKAYRQLALQYHPDKNSDPRAHQVFMLINEAYEILGSSEKRIYYNYIYDYCQADQSPTVNRPKPKSPPVEKQPRSYYSNQAALRPYTKYARWISVFTLAFCLALIIDYFGVRSYSNQVVHLKTANLMMTGWPGPNPYLTVKTQNCKFSLDGEKYNYVTQGDTVNAFITPLFNIATKVELLKQGTVHAFDPHYSVYNIFSFFLIALLLTSALGTFLTRRYPEHVFNAAVTNGTLFPFVLYFVLIS